MSPYEITELFRAQLGRHTKVKTALAPLSIKESAPIVLVIPVGMGAEEITQGDRVNGAPLTLHLRVRVTARIEGSGNGLKLAMDAAWAVTTYLAKDNHRIETNDGAAVILNSRIKARKLREDNFLEDFTTPTAADMCDEYEVTLTVPREHLI